MSHELFLTSRQTTKIRNAFANNMSTDIKLSKTQISKIVHSGGSFGFWIANLGKISTNKDNLPVVVSNLASNLREK